jgi:membrane AbrB-like protein
VEASEHGPFEKLPHALLWALLAALTALFASAFTWARLPAALLLGAMLGGILLSTAGAKLKVPAPAYVIAQAIIGCLVASRITAAILHTFLADWPLFLLIVTGIVVMNGLLGWLIGRLGILPGTTAIWGLLPGAASAMMVMAEAYGADARLVAFMQYSRVVMVATSTSLIAHFYLAGGAEPPPPSTTPEFTWTGLAATFGIIATGAILGRLSRLPAGVLLLTLALGSVLHVAGLADIVLPRWLLIVGYCALGWHVGLLFTRAVVLRALKALPQTVLSIAVMMGLCACLGLILARTRHIDFLTAFLATSPGGLDAIAIIAAATKVDLGFIMALQCVRFLLVLAIGPFVSRFLADRLGSKIR